MVLIKVNTYRHFFNGQSPTAHTSRQEDTDTNIKDILPPGVMENLDDYNISFSLSYPGREDIEISPTIDSLNNDNITKLFPNHIITYNHELNIRIRLARNSLNLAPRRQDSPLPRARRVTTQVPEDDDDDEAYGGGLRSSKRRKSKKRKSKRKSKKRKSKTRRRSR